MQMRDLIEKIKDWGVDRNIHTQEPIKQLDKLLEESKELIGGVYTKDNNLIKDSIGDIFVVLTMLSLQLNVDITECIELAYNEIKDRKGRLIDGKFVKSIE